MNGNNTMKMLFSGSVYLIVTLWSKVYRKNWGIHWLHGFLSYGDQNLTFISNLCGIFEICGFNFKVNLRSLKSPDTQFMDCALLSSPIAQKLCVTLTLNIIH